MIDPRNTGWRQVNIRSGDWLRAEHVGVHHLSPALHDAEAAGFIDAWWFVRKSECWRVRIGRIPEHGCANADTAVPAAIVHFLDRLATDGVITGYDEVIYEPETHAFGGPLGMQIAHWLFHHDSRLLLAYLATVDRPRRIELGLRLAIALMRAAGQEWYEQGDIWGQAAAHRQVRSQGQQAAASPRMLHAVAHLITADQETARSPLHHYPAWPAAYERAGQELAKLARRGQTTRGLRLLLTHHVLFAWNRLGISAADQHLIAITAQQIVFDQSPDALARILSQRPDPDKVTEMPTDTTDTAASPEQLRQRLVDTIAARGTFRTPEVEAAFRVVPRHLFLPQVPVEDAYALRPVVTRRDSNGESLSSASSPNLVAEMLEQADLRPGHRVLEIGTATGINAALIRELVGDAGYVVTIEYDRDLACYANGALEMAGYADVTVIVGDGAYGYPDCAPFDRIIVTAGAWTIAETWWDQLNPGGRMVVPLRLHESGLTRCFAFDHVGDGLLSSNTAPLVCGFVPMRGVDEHDDHHVILRGDLAIRVDSADQPDRDALAAVMDHPRQQMWSGIRVGDHDPIGHLDLWLLTHTTTSFGRLSVGPTARADGLATPAYRWAGAALYDGGTLAYIAFREIDADTQELGVIAHGPAAAALSAALLDLLHGWDHAGRPDMPTVTVNRRRDVHTDGAIARPNCTISIGF